MSTFNEINISCPNCGKEYKGIIWTAIHASQDPELKDLLLGGEINLLMCPDCAHVAYQEHFILYQDPAAELVAYIYPPSQQEGEEFLHTSIMNSFKDAQAIYPPKDRKDYDPILVFGLEKFVGMMQEEDRWAAQSQVAEAICKENSIPYKKLRPFDARRLRMLRVLPTAVASTHPARADVLGGLEKLLTINPTLDLYSKLCTKIQEDLYWKIK